MLKTFIQIKTGIRHLTTSNGHLLQKSLPVLTDLKFPTKVPQSATVFKKAAKRDPIDDQTIKLLERLSLVNLDSGEARKVLEDSVEFANNILAIDTNGVKPLYSVLENEILELRLDKATEENLRAEVQLNAKITEEEYFVAPPGNIPLQQDVKKSD